MGEEFKSISDTYYEINKSGLVRNTKTLKHNKFFISNGYLKIRFWNRKLKKYVTYRIHRLVWEVFIGEIPKGFDIHHKDKNRMNNNLQNLEQVCKVKHKDIEGKVVFTIFKNSLGFYYTRTDGYTSGYFTTEKELLETKIKTL